MQARWHGGDKDRAVTAALSTGVTVAEERAQTIDAGLLTEKCSNAAGADRGDGPCMGANGSAQQEDSEEDGEDGGYEEGDDEGEEEMVWEEGADKEAEEVEDGQGQEAGLYGAGSHEEEAAEEAELEMEEGGAQDEDVDPQQEEQPVLGKQVFAHERGASTPRGEAAAPVLAAGPSVAGQLVQRQRAEGAPAPGPQQGERYPPVQAASREYVRGRGRGAPMGGPRSAGQVTQQRLQELRAVGLAKAAAQGAKQEVRQPSPKVNTGVCSVVHAWQGRRRSSRSITCIVSTWLCTN